MKSLVIFALCLAAPIVWAQNQPQEIFEKVCTPQEMNKVADLLFAYLSDKDPFVPGENGEWRHAFWKKNSNGSQRVLWTTNVKAGEAVGSWWKDATVTPQPGLEWRVGKHLVSGGHLQFFTDKLGKECKVRAFLSILD